MSDSQKEQQEVTAPELSPKKMKRNALTWKLMANTLGSTKKVSPYISAMEPKDLKIFQLMEENKLLKDKCRQLSQALETQINSGQFEPQQDSVFQERSGSLDLPLEQASSSQMQMTSDFQQNQMTRTFNMDFDSIGDGVFTKTRMESIKKVLKEKDKENQAYMNQCILLKKQLERSKSRSVQPSNQITIEVFQDKLKSQQKVIEEQRKEILGLKKIQNEQGKALSKMTFENDYPGKIKALIDDLRYANKRLQEANEELSKEKKVAENFRNQNLQLQDQLKQKVTSPIPERKGKSDMGQYSFIGGKDKKDQLLFEQQKKQYNLKKM